MNNEFQIVFPFKKNLQNNISSYRKLIQLYSILDSNEEQNILLDFTNVTFLSANLLAVLGCCVDSTITKRKHKIAVSNLHPKIKAVMRKNGFNRYFTWEDLEDRFHSTMDYAYFKATTAHLVDFEKYLLLNVFSRTDIPTMNLSYKNNIIDNLLEMFNNVIDHANSNYVYVCGQFFPKSSNLTFTIVDIGKTIYQNVTSYLSKHNFEYPDITLKWAILPGHSTKATEAPGGLGFSTLLEFLRLNNGSFTLISDNEIYEIQPKTKNNTEKERFKKLDLSFPGTIVTVTINLKDKQFYILDETTNNLITF